MVVQHNLTAMNSNRMLGITTSTQAKSTEKLSSGYKINRAADDAAGLSISEKMRKQIRGLTQASLNAEDGISAVQTAEGALNEVQDMLQRMNELAVKAANGTNSADDRSYIQAEIDQLITEIDRVAETTKFNETYLLKGDDSNTTTVTVSKGTAKFEITDAGKYEKSYTLAAGATYWAVDAEGNVTALDENTSAEDLAKYITSEGKAQNGYAIYDVENGTDEWGVQTTAVDVAADKLDVIASGLMDADGNEVTDISAYFDTTTGVYKGGLYSTLSEDDADGNGGTKGKIVEIGAEKISNFVTVTPAETEEKEKNGALKFSLHVGADAANTNKIELNIEAMGAVAIGVYGLDVSTEGSATQTIDSLNFAIKKVSEQRSALGAIQNRLEHTIANLDNVVENTTAAESQIRDTDMATEMVKYSNNNILAQAGQAMLAQANQANQGVLSLLG